MYRDPKVVILDEPNSNLDEAGNAALERTLAALRSTQATVIIVTHRSRVLAQLDAVLLLIDGKLSLYGTPEQVAAELKQRTVGPVPNATDVRARRAVA